MATTTITIASFQNALAEAADAIAAESWGTAFNWVLRAQTIMSGLEASVAHAGTSATQRQNLKDLRDAVREGQAKAAQQSSESRWIGTTTTHRRFNDRGRP